MYSSFTENNLKGALASSTNGYQSMEPKKPALDLNQERQDLYSLEKKILNKELSAHEVIDTIISYITKSIEIMKNNQVLLTQWPTILIHIEFLEKRKDQLKKFSNEMTDTTYIGFDLLGIISNASNDTQSCKKYIKTDSVEISRYLRHGVSFLSTSHTFMLSVHPKDSPSYEEITGNQFNMATFFQDNQSKEKPSCPSCTII